MADSAKIITNNTARDILYWHELTERNTFNFLCDPGEFTFFRYKGDVHLVDDFMRVGDIGLLAGWDGYTNDTFFSGLVIKFVQDFERVIVGRWMA